mmetsp:Transcript_841/g.1766  ORF Transcript_841/g.1766 Transcript_841/m.1766 type:complete len:187 (-) Transcript_841:100-660(-)
MPKAKQESSRLELAKKLFKGRGNKRQLQSIQAAHEKKAKDRVSAGPFSSLYALIKSATNPAASGVLPPLIDPAAVTGLKELVRAGGDSTAAAAGHNLLEILGCYSSAARLLALTLLDTLFMRSREVRRIVAGRIGEVLTNAVGVPPLARTASEARERGAERSAELSARSSSSVSSSSSSSSSSSEP